MSTACIGVIYQASIKEHSAPLPPLAQWFVTGGQVEERPSQWPATVDVHHNDTDLLNCHLLLDVKEITAWHLEKSLVNISQAWQIITCTPPDNSDCWLNKREKRRMTLYMEAPASYPASDWCLSEGGLICLLSVLRLHTRLSRGHQS